MAASDLQYEGSTPIKLISTSFIVRQERHSSDLLPTICLRIYLNSDAVSLPRRDLQLVQTSCGPLTANGRNGKERGWKRRCRLPDPLRRDDDMDAFQ